MDGLALSVPWGKVFRITAPVSQDPILREYFTHTPPLGQLGPDLILAAHFLQGPRERHFRLLGGHHHDAINIAKDPVPRPYDAVPNADRLAVADPVQSALGIERAEPGRK